MDDLLAMKTCGCPARYGSRSVEYFCQHKEGVVCMKGDLRVIASKPLEVVAYRYRVDSTDTWGVTDIKPPSTLEVQELGVIRTIPAALSPRGETDRDNQRVAEELAEIEEIEFIEELAANAERIAKTKHGADKEVWLDDAKMHRRVAARLRKAADV